MKLLVFSLFIAMPFSALADFESAFKNLSDCSDSKTGASLAAATKSAVEGSQNSCNCNESGLDESVQNVQNITLATAQVDLHREVVQQSMINSLDKYYELSKKFTGENKNPIDVLCSIGCDPETKRMLSERLNYLKANYKPQKLSSNDAAQALNQQVGELNTLYKEYDTEEKRVFATYASRENLAKLYSNYVWKAYEANSGLLSTDAAQDDIGSLGEGWFDFRPVHRRHSAGVQKEDIASYTKEAKASIQAEFARLSKMQKHTDQKAVLNDLRGLVTNNPLAVGQVLARRSDLSGEICSIVAATVPKGDSLLRLKNLGMIALGAATLVATAATSIVAPPVGLALAAGALTAGAVGAVVDTRQNLANAERFDRAATVKQGALLSGSGDQTVADGKVESKSSAQSERNWAFINAGTAVAGAAGDLVTVGAAAKKTATGAKLAKATSDAMSVAKLRFKENLLTIKNIAQKYGKKALEAPFAKAVSKMDEEEAEKTARALEAALKACTVGGIK